MANENANRFASGKLPTTFQLRSALRVGHLLSSVCIRITDARNSYRLVPTGGLYRSEDLVVGEEVLRAAGLLREHEGSLCPSEGLKELSGASEADGCEALLYALLERHTPLWLTAATGENVFSIDLVPDEARDTIERVLSAETRERMLLNLSRPYNAEERSNIGEIAEEYVVRRCKAELREAGEPELANLTQRVSRVSDQLGYDVTAPRLDHSTRRLEVKGTRGGGAAITLYLSRNEAERGAVDPNWFLVACRVSEDEAVDLVGWLPSEALVDLLPVDPLPHSRWQSVRLNFSGWLFRPGLPPI